MQTKFYPRSGLIKNSNGNFKFNPETLQSWSYDWWQMTAKIGPWIIFNEYDYSNTTRKHQFEAKCQIRDRSSDTTLIPVEVPKGLQSSDWLEVAIENKRAAIRALEALIAKPRTHKAKNEERKQKIRDLKLDLRALTDLEGVA